MGWPNLRMAYLYELKVAFTFNNGTISIFSIPNFLCRDVAVPVPVKHPEHVEDLLVLLEVPHLGAHQLEELGDVDLAAAVVVNLLGAEISA